MTKHAEIAARLAAATPNSWPSYPADLPRTWEVERFSDGSARVVLPTPLGVTVNGQRSEHAIASYCTEADADFIAHAPTDIAFLLAENTRLEAERDKWLDRLDDEVVRANTAEAEIATLREALQLAIEDHVTTEHPPEMLQICRACRRPWPCPISVVATAALATPTATAREES